VRLIALLLAGLDVDRPEAAAEKVPHSAGTALFSTANAGRAVLSTDCTDPKREVMDRA
jgi:hypothetical protein